MYMMLRSSLAIPKKPHHLGSPLTRLRTALVSKRSRGVDRVRMVEDSGSRRDCRARYADDGLEFSRRRDLVEVLKPGSPSATRIALC